MKLLHLLSLLLILSICVNCEKEQTSLANGNKDLGRTRWEKTDTTTTHFAPDHETVANIPLIDTFPNPIPDSVFVVGRATSYLRVQRFEPIFVVDVFPGNNFETFYLDEAQQFSFSLSSSQSISSGGLNVRSGSLIIPTDSGLEYASYRYIDSTFICRTPDNWVVHYNNLSDYQCMGQDSFVRADEHVAARQHRYGYRVDQDNELLSFDSGQIQLSYCDQTFSEAGRSWNFTLGLWGEEPYYVVLRHQEEHRVRYGWLLLSIKGHNRVHLHEIAWPVD